MILPVKKLLPGYENECWVEAAVFISLIIVFTNPLSCAFPIKMHPQICNFI